MVTALASGVEHAISASDVNLQFFEAAAAEYDEWLHGAHGRLAARLALMAAPAPGESVLDVGAGTGLFANLAARAVGTRGEVVGVDESAAMLELARARAPSNASYFRASAERPLWFREEAFDLIAFCDSLTYFQSPRRLLTDAFRMLRPGGRLAVAVPCRSLNTRAQEVSRLVVERVLRTQPLTLPRPHPQLSLMGEPLRLGRLLLDAGFLPREVSTFITGVRARSSGEWLEIQRLSGPRPFVLLSSIGPAMQLRVAEQMEWGMKRAGSDAFRHHEAFTLAIAARDR